MIKEKLKSLNRGGKVFLPTGQYDISTPVVIDVSCIKLEGEVWNYSFKFVRNGGAFPDEFPYPRAAVCFYKVNNCSVRNNTFDMAGTFWYYNDDALKNSDKKVFNQSTPALRIEGNNNRIVGNTFSNTGAKSIIIKGDNNILMNNIVDKNIVIDGCNNIVANNVFTKRDAKIIVCNKEDCTEWINTPQHRIEYKV